MKIQTKYILLLYLAVINSFDVYSQGLEFCSSYQEEIDKRTAYTVFANQTPTMNDELTISFDLSILNPTHFGYLCAVDMNCEKCFYSLSVVNLNGEFFLKLNLEGESNLLTVPLKLSDWGKGKWNHLKLYFKFSGNDISVSVNDETHRYTGKKLDRSIQADIYFGKHNNIIDVPNFAIKNLTVKDSKSNYHFSFLEDSGNMVHNKKGKAIGYVENPKWLINGSYYWKHRYTQKSKSISVVQYDNINNRLIIAEEDSVTLVNTIDDSAIKKAYQNKHPVPMILGMSCMNTNSLLSYELRQKIPGYPTIASLNLNNLSWSINGYAKLDNERHHHNSYFDEVKQQLFIFGGFGDKRFYKSLHRYDFSSDTWNLVELSGDKIFPRFYSGMGVLNKHLVIFGGVGNPTGEQAVGKKYYYDCHLIDLENQTVKKLWEIDKGDTRLVSSRSLIFSSDSSSFYTICYPEYIPETSLKLYKYNLSNGEYEILGDSIPMISEQIKTNANLYMNSNTNEIYCVSQQYMEGDSCIINLYSINSSPLSISKLKTAKHNDKTNKTSFIWPLSFVLTIILLLFFYVRKRKRLKSYNEEESSFQEWSVQLPGPTKNAIYLFGDFAVFNRVGKEISYLFSPQMKQLFLYIALKSSDNGFGVDSEQIYKTIWPDKEHESAKNLKGVTINKIRNVLSDIDGIELIHENKYFILKTEKPLYFDYLEFITLHNLAQLNSDIENTKNLSRVFSRGQFLKGIEIDFLDLFKAEVSNQIIKIAPPILKQLFLDNNFSTCIYFAKILYFSDELNTCFFYFIIQSNMKLKRATEAKKQYAKYVNKYQKIQDEDYGLLFSDVVKASQKYIKNIPEHTF